MSDLVQECVEEYRRNRHHLSAFAESLRTFFANHPKLNEGQVPVLHSIRLRLKDEEHLRDKLGRKIAKGENIAPGTLLVEVTDLAGVRLLHLHQEQFSAIYQVIQEQLVRHDWALHEDPVAYTWDPESREFFEKHGLRTEVKETFYTSIHFLVKPRADSPICCELQVRTLFEEIWGEIDHSINYPHPTASVDCREQIRVLSRLVGAGSRLADSIFRANRSHLERLATVAVPPAPAGGGAPLAPTRRAGGA